MLANRCVIVLALVLDDVFAVLPHTSAAQNRYSLKVINRSKFDIYHMYMSTTETDCRLSSAGAASVRA